MRALWLVLLLALVLAAALAPRLVGQGGRADDTLVILSPHWDGIREEFERAFGEHWRKQTGRQVRFDWWDVGGGGGEIRRFILERARQARWDRGEGIGVDLLFGGGTFDHADFAQENFLAKQGVQAPGGLLEPHRPPRETLDAIPAEVNGQPLRDPGFAWHAACLSGFGIVYNRLVVEKARLPAPESWAELGRPEYYGWVSCGDPTKSGSVRMAFEVILQAYGWEEGWAVLARMCANVRGFNEGGASVPRDVGLGQAAAGLCIDFYAAAPVRRLGATHLVFVFPQGKSVITPDAIAVFRNAPHGAVARAFVDFVLSEAGQRLWYQKRGTPGGPVAFDLERLPVQPRLYEMGLPTYTVARPFAQGQAFPYDSRKGGKRWPVLPHILSAVLMNVHDELSAAWAAAIRAGRSGDLGAALGRPPVSEEQLFALAARRLPPAQMNALRSRWSGWARERYQAIERAAESGQTAPEFVAGPVEP
jgi:ABC-type Fe3+ transport system substrate-binding protein